MIPRLRELSLKVTETLRSSGMRSIGCSLVLVVILLGSERLMAIADDSDSPFALKAGP